MLIHIACTLEVFGLIGAFQMTSHWQSCYSTNIHYVNTLYIHGRAPSLTSQTNSGYIINTYLLLTGSVFVFYLFFSTQPARRDKVWKHFAAGIVSFCYRRGAGHISSHHNIPGQVCATPRYLTWQSNHCMQMC